MQNQWLSKSHQLASTTWCQISPNQILLSMFEQARMIMIHELEEIQFLEYFKCSDIGDFSYLLF